MGTDAFFSTEAFTTAENGFDTTNPEMTTPVELPIDTTTTEEPITGTEDPVTGDSTTGSDVIKTTDGEILPIETTTEPNAGTVSTTDSTTDSTTASSESPAKTTGSTEEINTTGATTTTTSTEAPDDGPNLGLILGLTFGILGAIGGGVLIWYCCFNKNTVDVADVEMGEQDDSSSDESSSEESD